MATTQPYNNDLTALFQYISDKFGEEVGYWVQQEIENAIADITALEAQDIAELRQKIDTIDAILDGDDANTQSAVRNIIATIAQHTAEIGDLNSLNTSVKDNLVNAVNEVNTKATAANAKASANEAKIGDTNGLNTADNTSLVNAINEVKRIADNGGSKLGDLNNLNTNAKDTVVNAINETLDVANGAVTKTEVQNIVADSLICVFRNALAAGKQLKIDGNPRSVNCTVDGGTQQPL